MSGTESEKVAIVLMKSEEADATIDVLQADSPSVEVEDHGTYWLLRNQGEIVVPMSRIGEELGRPIELFEWLVILSSFVGRAAPGADYFRVTSQMLEFAEG